MNGPVTSQSQNMTPITATMETPRLSDAHVEQMSRSELQYLFKRDSTVRLEMPARLRHERLALSLRGGCQGSGRGP